MGACFYCFNAVVAGLSKADAKPDPDVKGPGFGMWPTCLWPNSVSDYSSLLRKYNTIMTIHTYVP